MDNPYDLYSWSRLYREDALREARERRLVRAGRGEPPGTILTEPRGPRLRALRAGIAVRPAKCPGVPST